MVQGAVIVDKAFKKLSGNLYELEVIYQEENSYIYENNQSLIGQPIKPLIKEVFVEVDKSNMMSEMKVKYNFINPVMSYGGLYNSPLISTSGDKSYELEKPVPSKPIFGEVVRVLSLDEDRELTI